MSTPRISESDFCAWLGRAVAGEIFVYHRGFLARDTNYAVSELPTVARVELAHVARSTMWAAEEGLVHLLQRRIGPEEFNYLAVARPRARSCPLPNQTRITKEKP